MQKRINMKYRIRELIKKSGKSQQEIAKELDITYNALYNRMDSPNGKSLEEFARILNCEVHELIETSEGYAHFYDDKTGEWLGIRKK